MGSISRTHNATVPIKTAEKLAVLAEEAGLAESTYVRRVVEEYAQGKPEAKQPGYEPATRYKYRVDDEVFAAAQARAAAENRSISAAITAEIERTASSH